LTFVIDASIAISWAFDDEEHPGAAAALERLRDEDARAPALWVLELRNALLAGERRGRIEESGTERFLDRISRLPIQIDREAGEVLGLARRHRLSAYDASYLELACRLGVPLLTLDRALADAARVEGGRGF
jgi:predicted nucleic acid-binding protein